MPCLLCQPVLGKTPLESAKAEAHPKAVECLERILAERKQKESILAEAKREQKTEEEKEGAKEERQREKCNALCTGISLSAKQKGGSHSILVTFFSPVSVFFL